jgi:hypothetical protein
MAYTTEEKIEIFKVLYPLFKGEIYNRRDQILKVGSISTGVFLFLIFLAALLKGSGISLKADLYPLLSGFLFFEAVICYHLYQHKTRHEQAKRLMIKLEEEMGFFKEGIFDASKSFYPEKWKIRGWDPGYILYPSVHAGLITMLGFLIC